MARLLSRVASTLVFLGRPWSFLVDLYGAWLVAKPNAARTPELQRHARSRAARLLCYVSLDLPRYARSRAARPSTDEGQAQESRHYNTGAWVRQRSPTGRGIVSTGRSGKARDGIACGWLLNRGQTWSSST